MFNELLSSMTVPQLKPRLAALETGERPTRKADIIALLRSHMLSPRLRDYWEKLETVDQYAVAEAIYHCGGRFDPVRFSNKYLDLPQIFRASGTSGSKQGKGTNNTLSLFFYSGVVPEELCLKLKAFVPQPEADILAVISDEDLPDVCPPAEEECFEEPVSSRFRIRKVAMETVVRHDLPALLHLVDGGQINVSDKTGLATAASLRKIEAILMGGDFYCPEDEEELNKWDPGPLAPIRPYAWPLLLQSGGLAKRNGKKLALTRKGKMALHAPFSETLKELYGRWRDKGLVDEFRRINVVKGQSGKGRRMTAAAERRVVIEEALISCPVGEWVQIDELFRFMQAQGHDFEVAHDPWKLYVTDRHYGSLGYGGHHGFEILQGRYILAYLFEYLATMGMIDVAYTLPFHIRDDFRELWGIDDLKLFSRYDGLLYFRLNPLGAWCINLYDEYQPTESSESPLLTVSENLQIDLVRMAEPEELLLLDCYAARISAQTWQLSPETVFNALDQGQNPELFFEFLERHSQQPLGPAVIDFFTGMENRKMALKDGGGGRLLHCSNTKIIALLISDPGTRDYCLKAGPKLLVIPEKAEKGFREGLRKLGYIFPAG